MLKHLLFLEQAPACCLQPFIQEVYSLNTMPVNFWTKKLAATEQNADKLEGTF